MNGKSVLLLIIFSNHLGKADIFCLFFLVANRYTKKYRNEASDPM